MTSIGISNDYLEILHELVVLHEAKSTKDLTESMILYFKETGINPTSKIRSTSDELAKLRNTLVSFIREQEKTKLNPMIKQINEITETFIHFLNEEALRKSDLKDLVNKLEPSPIERNEKSPIEASSGQRISNADYERLLKRARQMFVDFLKNGKKSTFGGGMVFDHGIIENYSAEFAKLKF